MTREDLQEHVLALNPKFKEREGADKAAVVVPVEVLLELLKTLRDQDQFCFDMLVSHTAVDQMDDGVFELIYQLYSMSLDHSLQISALIPRENPIAPSASSLWEISQWQEREVYDLFGVKYENHPDLRRLFLDDEWEGFPLRKDYKDDFMLEMPVHD